MLRGRSKEDAKILFVGLLNLRLPQSTRPVLVGGALIEFLTGGGYLTADIDLVGDRPAVRPLLLAAGFEESGRYFVSEDLGLTVEVPSRHLRPSENVVEVEFEGLPVAMVSMEDALVDRLLAAKFWKSVTDWEQALLLYGAQGKRMDDGLLRTKAEANDVRDFLDRVRSEMGKSAARGRIDPRSEPKP